MGIIVKSYSDKIINFECDGCKINDTYDVSNLITDNCALDIDIACRECTNTSVVYILCCTDAALAKDLNSRLEVLRLNRMAGGIVDGHKNGEQNRSRAE